jgi:anti-sigma regulatory factor (Ser/Thr protein kinase)
VGLYPSAPSSVAVLRAEATAIATRRGLTGTALSDVTLGVSEAATNAVTHGSGSASGHIGMAVAFARGAMQVTISDEGCAEAAWRKPEPDRGHGLRIMRAITNGNLVVATNGAGTTVTMDFACPARANHASLVRRPRPTRRP